MCLHTFIIRKRSDLKEMFQQNIQSISGCCCFNMTYFYGHNTWFWFSSSSGGVRKHGSPDRGETRPPPPFLSFRTQVEALSPPWRPADGSGISAAVARLMGLCRWWRSQRVFLKSLIKIMEIWSLRPENTKTRKEQLLGGGAKKSSCDWQLVAWLRGMLAGWWEAYRKLVIDHGSVSIRLTLGQFETSSSK